MCNLVCLVEKDDLTGLDRLVFVRHCAWRLCEWDASILKIRVVVMASSAGYIKLIYLIVPLA